MLEILPQIPLYLLFRRFGRPGRYPLSLTINVTNHCNCKCLTCNIWRKREEEFTLSEYERTFRGMHFCPTWITFSGGEPMLRRDFGAIVDLACQHLRPGVINIPTNGLLTERILQVVEAICKRHPQVRLIVNVSMDGYGARHDEIRGVPGIFEHALDTFKGLKALKSNGSNLTVGIHTVISVFNVDYFPVICDRLLALGPDSYITEIAEERQELQTIGCSITPSAEAYSQAIRHLISKMEQISFRGISRIIQAFRLEYYNLVQQVLAEKRQVLNCYSGFISAQLMPNGDLTSCCITSATLGNLRQSGYNFDAVWFSSKAREIRWRIRNKECFCPLANAAYTNMLCSPRKLAAVAWKAFGPRRVRPEASRQ